MSKGADVLVMVRTHPSERSALAFRDAFLANPPGNTDILDAWSPEIVADGSRFLHDVADIGNLSLQYGIEPWCPNGPPTTPKERAILTHTRQQTRNNLKIAERYRDVVDVHGCGAFYPTLAWISDTPTPRELTIAYALNPGVAILTGRWQLPTRLGHGVAPEIADGDEHRIPELLDLIGRIAADNYIPPTMEQIGKMKFYEYVGGISAKGMSIPFKDTYDHLEEMPSGVANHLGISDQPLYALTWNASRRGGEIVREVPRERVQLPLSPSPLSMAGR
jgi:hypothetical protein